MLQQSKHKLMGAWVGISALSEACKNHMESLKPEDLEGDLCGR